MLRKCILILSVIGSTAGADAIRLWSRGEGEESEGTIYRAKIAFDSTGDLILAGVSGASNCRRITICKLAGETGNILWRVVLADCGEVKAMALDATGAVFVGATAWGAQSSEYALFKLDRQTGSVIWDARYHASVAKPTDVLTHMVYDPRGYVVCSGYSYPGSSAGGDGTADIHTISYRASDGFKLWSQSYKAGPGFSDVATALALNSGGDVFLAGHSSSSSTNPQPVLIKYSAAAGSVIWKNVITSPSFFQFEIQAIAVDGSGDLFMPAYYQDTFGDPGTYIAKHSGDDGSRIWDDISYYTSTIPWIYADTRGSVWYASEGVTKFNAATGAILWTAGFDGYNGVDPGFFTGNPYAMAVTSAGAVYSSGAVSPLFQQRGPAGILVAKHMPETGQLVWQKLHALTTTMVESMNVWDIRLAVFGENRIVTNCSFTNFNNTQLSETVCYAIVTPIEAWRHQYFNITTNSGNAADAADPDFDGVPNLVEWGCLSDPLQAGTSPLSVSVSPGGVNISYTRSTAAVNAGARYAFEWSSTLDGGWSSEDTSSTVVSQNGISQSVNATVPGSGSQRFIRLRVSY